MRSNCLIIICVQPLTMRRSCEKVNDNYFLPPFETRKALFIWEMMVGWNCIRVEIEGREMHCWWLPLFKLASFESKRLSNERQRGKINSKREMPSSFFQTIGLNDLRIRLADTTHVNITVSEISDVYVHQLGLYWKLVFLTFFHSFPHNWMKN